MLRLHVLQAELSMAHQNIMRLRHELDRRTPCRNSLISPVPGLRRNKPLLTSAPLVSPDGPALRSRKYPGFRHMESVKARSVEVSAVVS